MRFGVPDYSRGFQVSRSLFSLPSILLNRLLASAKILGPVLQATRVRPLITSSLLARLPKGVVPLATVLLINQRTGSYLIAGAVVGLVALSDAITTPMQGWLVDRFGLAPVVLPAAAVHVLGVALLLGASGADGAEGRSVVAACLIGSGNPPISAAMKSLWPRLVGQRTMPAAYIVESLVQQLVFLSGPLIVTVVVTIGSPRLALILSAGLLATGSLWFVVAAPATAPAGARRTRRSGALRNAAVRVLLSGTTLQGVAFGALPIGLASLTAASGTPDLVGVLQAALTVGGLLGTLAPIQAIDEARYVRLVAGFALTLVPFAAMGATTSRTTAALTGPFLLVAGLFLTPIAAASYVLLHQATNAMNRTEAFAWLSTGQAVGSATGAAVGGLIVDHAGTFPALVMIPVTVALASVVSHRWLT